MNDYKFIARLLEGGNSEQLELLSEFNIDEVSAIVCGFLNTKGGRLILGLNKKRRPHEIPEFDKVFHLLHEVLYEKIKPSSIISITKNLYKEGNIILIEVLEGNKKPYSYMNETFIRRGSRTVSVGGDEMSLLLRERKIYESSWERTLCLEASMTDLDTSELSNSIKLANEVKRSSPFDVNDSVKFLQSNQLLDSRGLTNGAVVLYAKDPTYFIPQCSIRIVEFPEGKTGSKFSNTLLIEDNFFKAYREVQSYFKRSIPLVSRFEKTEWQREDSYKYPMDALDEAVINAMMHRDYSDGVGEVFIGVYPDRMEIINSGELPSFLTDAKLKKSHQSIPPNPCITHVVFLCGIIEKVGRGTILINNQFNELGLPAPNWDSKNGFTKLTLYGEPKDLELNQRMSDFLKSLSEPNFSRQDYEDFFNSTIAEKTARNDLTKLMESGYISKSGRGASTRYIRTEKRLPEGTGL